MSQYSDKELQTFISVSDLNLGEKEYTLPQEQHKYSNYSIPLVANEIGFLK